MFDLLALWQLKYAISLTIAAIFFYLFGRGKSVPSGKTLPGTRGWPIIGYWQILLKHPYEEIHKLGAKYGKLFMITIGRYKFVVLNDLEIIKDAFIKQGDMLTDRPGGFNNVHYIFDNGGIFMESGENYKELRNFFVNSMKQFGLGFLNTEIALAKQGELAVEYVESLKRAPFDPMFLFGCITNNVILKFVMEKEYSYNDPELARIIYLAVHVDSYCDRLWISDYLPWFSNFKGIFQATPTLRREKEEMYAFFKRNVEEHQASFNENNIRDYIDAFLNKINQRQKSKQDIEDPVYNIKQLLASMAIILLGANVSVPVTLSMLLKNFMRQPEIQEKINDEVNRVIGDRSPTYTDQRNMPYTEAAISEAIRVSDVVPLGTLRTVNDALTIYGYEIPKGSIIVGNFSKILFDPTLWKDPKSFNVNNFLDAEGNFVNHDFFMPFGAGRRICPGIALGKMELFLITTFLVQKFKFRAPTSAEIRRTNVRYSQHVLPFQVVAEKRF